MARLLAIHSGKAQIYVEDGVAFTTAICKQPVSGPVSIDKNGLVGNEVANHKNAVYAFCAENYDYWNQHLQLAEPWQYGTLGENLTLEGIDESAVHIGDLFKIGTVLLQVSGCRAPCENLLWRVQQSSSFLRPYQQSGRSGIYLEVLETGVIQAGDGLQHIRCDQPSISVPELARFLLNSQPSADELERLTAIPGMGQQMLSALVAARNLQIEKTLVQTNRWSGWKPFVVSEIVQESRDIKSFYLTPEGGGTGVAGYRAGQFLSVRLTLKNGQQLVRCWSISVYDESLRRYRISIKREVRGQASIFMHDHLQLGDRLELLAPCGHFSLKRGEVAVPVILISAGVGITPMVSMLHAHLARQDKRLPSLYFIHSTQNAQTHAFAGEVAQLLAQHPQLRSHIVYTRPDTGSVAGRDYQSSERLNGAALEQILEGIGCWFSEKWIELGAADCEYYLCGPDEFVEQIRLQLDELGVPAYAIFHESFSGGLGSLDGVQLPEASVSFSHSQQQAQWRQDDDLSLLELAEQAGLNPEFSCRSGRCGLCRVPLLQGEVLYPRLPSIELAPGEVLLCCSLPKGDLVLAI